MEKIKLIYNPHAGKKKFFGLYKKKILPEVLALLKKHEMRVDLFPTKKAGHATELARKAQKEGYELVVTIGGDGTASEAANGLIGGDIALGIIPTGTVMNTARMLSIPMDLEGAIKVIKNQHVKKIDAGVILRLDGEKLSEPYYFLETSGIGMEAHLQFEFKRIEKGDFTTVTQFFRNKFSFKPHDIDVFMDGEMHHFKSNLISVANGPLSGAALEMAPDARLDDHLLTLVVYKHDKFKLIKHFLSMIFLRTVHKRELKIFKAKEIEIRTRKKMLVHADASLFGETPVKYQIKPACLKVICGDLKNAETPNRIVH